MNNSPLMKMLYEELERNGMRRRFSGSSKEDFNSWKRKSKRLLKHILAIQEQNSLSVPSAVYGTSAAADGYIETKAYIETEPSVLMPLWILSPENCSADNPIPAVIAIHGHGCYGKDALIGKYATAEEKDCIEKYNYSFALDLVRMGYVVLCPDTRGFGERQENMNRNEISRIKGCCREINNMALPLGKNITGMNVFDMMRLLDWASSLPYIRKNQIGVAGFSGGGMCALYLGAIDQRVRCTVVSGYFYGAGKALLEQPWNCSCNYIPNMWKYFDIGDVASMHAPKPLYTENGTEDGLNGEDGIANVSSQINIVKKAYEAAGHPERFMHHFFHGGHRWEGKESYSFLQEWLR